MITLYFLADYETPDAIEATELSWPTPTIQRLWFGTVQEDKQKRIQAFLSCMHCDELPHGNLPPHMLIMACVLRYELCDINISLSSFEQPIRIPNFCNEFFVYLLFEYFYQVKVLN